MFSAIKSYVNIIIGVIVTAFLGYVEYLRVSNKNKDTQIDTLNNNIAQEKEKSKDAVKVAKFDGKVSEMKSTIDKRQATINKEAKNVKTDNNDSNFVDVGV